MTVEEERIINEIKGKLRFSALEDIKKCSNAGSIIGAFILSSCLIDTLAGFRYGQDGNLKLGKVFRAFVEEYLKGYDKVALYYDLRCQLVHNYSEGGSYFFINNRSELHLTQAEGKKIYLNLEDLIADLEKAIFKLFDDIGKDEDILKNMIKRYQKYGLVSTNRL